MQIDFNPADILQILPWITVVVFSVAVLLIDVFATDEKTDRAFTGYLALAGIAIAFLLNFMQMGNEPSLIMFGMLKADGFGLFFNAVVLFAAAISVLLGIGYFREHGLQRGEFYALLLMSLSGMMLMGMSSDLLSFFVALELMSIPIYVLAAFQRHLDRSIEAALKYFLMGAFSTAFMLFGIAFTYGAVGSTSLADTVAFVEQSGITASPYLALGMIFILIGFCFKVAAVPFHMWTPDTYQGSPTPVTAFMASAVKAAAFAAFLRIFITAFYELKLGDFGWYNVIWVVAILTMTLGNISALVQDNIKRMLAYSSIAHAGYLLVGFLTITNAKENNGASAILFYLAGYAVMNLGAFAVIILAGKRDRENLEISKGWAGFGLRSPVAGVAMLIFMLSMAGIPPTVGFMGKFYIFKSALDQGLVIIAIIGIVNSIISVYYYLRVLVYMYMVESDESEDESTSSLIFKSLPIQISVLISACLVMYLGLMPSGLLNLAREAVKSLF